MEPKLNLKKLAIQAIILGLVNVRGKIMVRSLPLDRLENACFRAISSKPTCDFLSSDSLPNGFQALIFCISIAIINKELYKKPRDNVVSSATSVLFLSTVWEFVQALDRGTQINFADLGAEILGAFAGGLLYLAYANRTHASQVKINF